MAGIWSKTHPNTINCPTWTKAKWSKCCVGITLNTPWVKSSAYIPLIHLGDSRTWSLPPTENLAELGSNRKKWLQETVMIKTVHIPQLLTTFRGHSGSVNKLNPCTFQTKLHYNIKNKFINTTLGYILVFFSFEVFHVKCNKLHTWI